MNLLDLIIHWIYFYWPPFSDNWRQYSSWYEWPQYCNDHCWYKTKIHNPTTKENIPLSQSQFRQNLLVLANDFPQLLTENTDVEFLWTIFKNALLHLMARYIPCKTTSKRQHLPWITDHIRKLIKKRDVQYKIYKTQNIKIHWSLQQF